MSRIAAVIFDVDGTLYDAPRMRWRLALDLGGRALRRPSEAMRAAPILRAYRKAHEQLRGGHVPNLGEAQVALAARLCGVAGTEVRRIIDRWFEQAPLDSVAAAVRPGLGAGLRRLRAGGLRLAVLSDYPPLAKLRAMRVADHFDHVAWAQQPGIERLKPDPTGLHAVLEALGTAPGQTLYVGDRPDVDVGVAHAAGCRAALMGARAVGTPGVPRFAEIEALATWVLGDGGGAGEAGDDHR